MKLKIHPQINKYYKIKYKDRNKKRSYYGCILVTDIDCITDKGNRACAGILSRSTNEEYVHTGCFESRDLVKEVSKKEFYKDRVGWLTAFLNKTKKKL